MFQKSETGAVRRRDLEAPDAIVATPGCLSDRKSANGGALVANSRSKNPIIAGARASRGIRPPASGCGMAALFHCISEEKSSTRLRRHLAPGGMGSFVSPNRTYDY